MGLHEAEWIVPNMQYPIYPILAEGKWDSWEIGETMTLTQFYPDTVQGEDYHEVMVISMSHGPLNHLPDMLLAYIANERSKSEAIDKLLDEVGDNPEEEYVTVVIMLRLDLAKEVIMEDIDGIALTEDEAGYKYE